MSTECSQDFIIFSDTESVEHSNNVQLDEDSDSAQIIQGFRDQRQEILVFDSDDIQASVVNTEIKTFSEFLHEQDWDCCIRVTDLNEFFAKILI